MKVEKEKKTKPKSSIREEIIKIRGEINKMENRENKNMYGNFQRSRATNSDICMAPQKTSNVQINLEKE